MNLDTYIIQGDLSRNDLKVLYELCLDKDVVEFGVGGSTIFLSQIAKSLVSYDTDIEWIQKTKSRLPNNAIDVKFMLSPGVPITIPHSDVLFIDGLGDHRTQWVKSHFMTTNMMICHDSLGDTGFGPTVYHVLKDLFLERCNVENIDSVLLHYKDSNMAVIKKRSAPILYVNWNTIEDQYRLRP